MDRPVQEHTELPRPGEKCSCGRPAIVVYVTRDYGRVAFCGINDGGYTERSVSPEPPLGRDTPWNGSGIF